MRHSPAFCATVLLIQSSAGQKIIEITGADWKLEGDPYHNASVSANTPSDQYVDLYKAGVIKNPVYGFNDTDEQWVQLSNWTYTSPSLHALQGQEGTRTWLVFEGLDTFATVSMCGEQLFNANNQFRQWLHDVTDVLSSCTGDVQLSIDFGPPVNITHQIGNSSVADGDDNFADSCNSDSMYGCKIYARKEQNDFGWDWSPSLVPSGIWRPIYAVQLTEEEPVYVNNALIDIFRQGQRNNLPPDQLQPWVFNASLDFVGELPIDATLYLQLSDSAGELVVDTAMEGVYQSNMTITGHTTIDPSKVELWWPSGHGAQNLYTAMISVVSTKAVLTQVERKTGFRTIVLNLSPITETQLSQGISPGANWHFEINGQDLYCKGSNLVPPSPFWPTVNETKMRQLFELVTDGNQNMLRVWASGAYLADWIYELADQMGILLWSEFEFSDAEYPNTTLYLENYQNEVYYNVRRVNYHPSLAVWVGGNELEQIILSYFANSTIQDQYEQIFLEEIIKCVYANTRSISYMPSSTYHGYLSLDFDRVMPQIPRYLNSSGPDALYSNSDYYNYDAYQAFNYSSYPVARFADEFGFHSMPSLQAWASEAPASDWYMTSPTVVHHNRHYPFGALGSDEDLSLVGIEEMLVAVKVWYPKPSLSDPVANFSAWIYSTQVLQADVYQHQIAFYRRGSGLPNRQLGALYWMLEDLWAAPTWASVDFLGRQKVTYYATKDIYQPIIVYAYYNATTYDTQIWVISDLWSSASGTVTYQWMDYTGNTIPLTSTTNATADGGSVGNATASLPFQVGPINSTQVLVYDNLSSTLTAAHASLDDAVLRMTVTGTSDGQEYNHTCFFHPTAIGNTTLHDPGLELKHESGTTFTVTATSAVAAWVWVDYTSTAVQGYWSDNGFWLASGESRTITFTVWNDWSDGEWIETVTVRSLWDNKKTENRS